MELAAKHIEYFNGLSIGETGTMLDPFDEKLGIPLEISPAWLRDHELRNWLNEQDVTKGRGPSNRHMVWKVKCARSGLNLRPSPREVSTIENPVKESVGSRVGPAAQADPRGIQRWRAAATKNLEVKGTVG